MFKVNSNKDRLNYGEILTPPAGYSLDAAVGTTFSLDMEALTALSISLGLGEGTDSELIQYPIGMLNALQKVADRVLIFCDSGQIKPPSNSSSLYVLLEKMVIPVSLPASRRQKEYPAFHPKTWVISYKNKKGEKIYRFVVLSRNLTFDRSWDVSVALDGSIGEYPVESSEPIVHFLNFLQKQIKPDFSRKAEKKSLLRKITKEIAAVTFTTNSKIFSDFQIMPLGIGPDRYDIIKDALLTDTYHELLAMSPFLSPTVVNELFEDGRALSNCRRTLITRKDALDKLKAKDTEGMQAYILKDRVYEGENELSGESDERQNQDIHAKLYIRRKYANVDLYLGSMNATHAALHSNVELMIRLRTKNHYLNTESFLRDLFDGNYDSKGNPFELASPTEQPSFESPDELNEMERQLRDLCRAGGKAEVTGTGGRYQIRVTYPARDWKFKMTLSPLFAHRQTSFRENMLFEDLNVLQVSEFYKVKISGGKMGDGNDLERVIMIPTANIPSDRDQHIVQSIVKDNESFMEYVSFVLDDNYLHTLIGKRKTRHDKNDKNYETVFPAIYEKMLKMSSVDPERLNEIDALMNMISDSGIIPDGFQEMYDTFKGALGPRKSR